MIVLLKATKASEGTPCEITYYEIVGPFKDREVATRYGRPDMLVIDLIAPPEETAISQPQLPST